MLKMRDQFGNTYNLSDTIYEVTEEHNPNGIGHKELTPGTLVRLISGFDDSPVPGAHPDIMGDWVTVCPVKSTHPVFLGFPKAKLSPEIR